MQSELSSIMTRKRVKPAEKMTKTMSKIRKLQFFK